jgi:hypothetical protein
MTETALDPSTLPPQTAVLEASLQLKQLEASAFHPPEPR